MRLYIDGKPQAKARPRLGKHGVYDKQEEKKNADKWRFALQMREKGYRKLSSQPLCVSLTTYSETPKSWTKAKRMAFSKGLPCIGRSDFDNQVKYYFDVLNDIAYTDDVNITELWAEKIHWHKSGIEIEITPLGEKMIFEHALVTKKDITDCDLERMVKKANKIGLSGRRLIRVYSKEDAEGKHFFFECDPLKGPRNDS